MRKLLFTFVLFSSSLCFAQVELMISYMSGFSHQIVHRPLTTQEISLIRTQGVQSFETITREWFNDPRFIDSAQFYVENLIRTSGQTNTVNMDIPGYLGRDIARRQRPYADLVTAPTCVNREGQTMACDSGAPFSAGVLTTKAYLVTKVGPYNIARAGKMVSQFLCTTYPLPETDEPRIALTDLIPQFATVNGAITFGNGNNCYSCHSQFGHHAQLFVKFDLSGNYQASATGVQNPAATDGFSTNNTFTSHYRNAQRAAQESSQFLGQPAANLSAAGRVLAGNRRFLPCAVKNLMTHYMRLQPSVVTTIKPDLYMQIADRAKTYNMNPSFSHLLTAIIANQAVFDSYVKSGVQP